MTAAIRTLVADDESLSRRMLRALVAKDPELALVGEARDGPETLELIEKHQPELALLDVMMPGFDSFVALARAARRTDRMPVLIFITAHPEHAVRAFEVEAIDYLLKPFDDERFARATLRGKEAVRRRQLVEVARSLASGEAVRPESASNDRLVIKDGRDVVLVDVSTIDWIEAADYYAQLHVNGKDYLIREPLHLLERKLDHRFLRIHRSAIVNLNRVERLERAENGCTAVLKDGTRLKVSRSRRAQLAELLG